MKRMMILSLFTSVCISVYGQEITQQQVTLREAEQCFMTNNLQLLAAHYEISKADAAIVQARLFENPVVSFEQNVYNRLNGRYFDFGKDGQTAVELEQLIYIAGQYNNRIKLEKANKEIAQYQFEEVVRTLRSELKKDFIRLFYAIQSQQIYETEISSLAKVIETVGLQQEQGNISLLERTRLEALLLSLQKDKNELSSQIIDLQAAVKLLMGIPADQPLVPFLNESFLPSVDLKRIPFSDLLEFMLVRPDVKLAEAQIQTSVANQKLQKSLAFPEVSIKGTYDKAGNFINNYWAIGVNVSIPIFNRNQGNIKAARFAIEQSHKQEEQVRREAENELFSTYSRLDKALELYKKTNWELTDRLSEIIRGVNQNFLKRNISLLEFIDYYNSYKEIYLQMNQIKQDLFLAVEDINIVTDHNVFVY